MHTRAHNLLTHKRMTPRQLIPPPPSTYEAVFSHPLGTPLSHLRLFSCWATTPTMPPKTRLPTLCPSRQVPWSRRKLLGLVAENQSAFLARARPFDSSPRFPPYFFGRFAQGRPQFGTASLSFDDPFDLTTSLDLLRLSSLAVRCFIWALGCVPPRTRQCLFWTIFLCLQSAPLFSSRRFSFRLCLFSLASDSRLKHPCLVLSGLPNTPGLRIPQFGCALGWALKSLAIPLGHRTIPFSLVRRYYLSDGSCPPPRFMFCCVHYLFYAGFFVWRLLSPFLLICGVSHRSAMSYPLST